MLVLVSIALLYRSAHGELAPQEDQGFMGAQPTSAPNATLQQKLLYAGEEYKIIKAEHAIQNVFQFAVPGQQFDGLILRPITERDGATLVSQRLQRYARLVGKENVIAGTDCGFGGRSHPQIAWAKLRALVEGAALASKVLGFH